MTLARYTTFDKWYMENSTPASEEEDQLIGWLGRADVDDALLRQALEALEYHTAQTRPIETTRLAIAALRAHLGVAEGEK